MQFSVSGVGIGTELGSRFRRGRIRVFGSGTGISVNSVREAGKVANQRFLDNNFHGKNKKRSEKRLRVATIDLNQKNQSLPIAN